MNLHVHKHTDLKTIAADSLVVFYAETSVLPTELTALDEVLGGELQGLFADGEATGKANSVTHVRTNGRIAAKHLYLVGVGKADKVNAEVVRKAAGTVSRSVRGESVAVSALTCAYAGAITEGLLMGRYVYHNHKSEPEADKRYTTLHVYAETDVSAAVEAAHFDAEAVNLARDLTNTPANLLDPVIFADKAVELGTEVGLEVEVLDEEKLQELGLNLLWSVGKGSEIPPRLVVLRYNGAPDSKEVLGIVGKGVTFDTGGYIIKPETGMGDMKTDMGGAACVLGAMRSIAQRKLNVNAIGILTLAENMISGSAFKPGDVAVAFNGKTVEMIDTDCEGRLVMADGIAYVKHLGATKIVDTATLTGAVVVVLGSEAASLYGNDDQWVEEVKQAGAEVGERLFPLPNYPEYQKLIESSIADYINYSYRNAASIAGGVFLAAFADDVPFVHIDMANVSRAKKTSGYTIEEATGFSTRSLIKVAERLAK
ncbi:leucyl aminopeptidase [Tumebacillus algifaecis]|uniref:leucyl aminopeptidase n=1 Tax=Tumebacillus algifaecis TaxID=1214604 RepID=UPI0012FE6E78|nr:leucyl aminopeptidase [Tumebacillus algifaecis]